MNLETECGVNPNVHRNPNSVPYYNEVINELLKKRSGLNSDFAENTRNLGQTFHDFGEQFAVFLQSKGTFPDRSEIRSLVGTFIFHQDLSHALNEKQAYLDDQIVAHLLIHDRNIYSEGFEQQADGLQEMFASGEMGAPEYVEKLSYWHRWFENYPVIEKYLKQKLENLISWEKMVTEIDQLLQLPFYDIESS